MTLQSIQIRIRLYLYVFDPMSAVVSWDDAGFRNYCNIGLISFC